MENENEKILNKEGINQLISNGIKKEENVLPIIHVSKKKSKF